jgi:hypothetical protein
MWTWCVFWGKEVTYAECLMEGIGKSILSSALPLPAVESIGMLNREANFRLDRSPE